MTATTSRPTARAAAPQRPRRGGPGFRGDIEGLRALAVLLVVAFHAGVPFLEGGFVGVDVFFVLSGFLITGLLVDELAATGRISLNHFYARRVRRLLPVSTLVLAATAAATYALIPPIDRAGVGGDTVAAALWVANWRFAVESTQYMADSAQSPLLHYWSLSVEEQFYLIWPVLLILIVGRTGLPRRAWSVAVRRIALVLSVLAALSLAVSWASTDAGPMAYFGLHTRAWELAVGGLLALARPSLRLLTGRAARAAACTGVALVLGSVLVIDEATPFPGLAALGPVVGTVMLVAAGARLPGEGVPALLAHPALRYVGRVSYAWYLWHWPCLVLAHARWPQLSLEAAPEAAPRAPWPVVLAAVAVSFGLAVASHYIVERPLRGARFLRVSHRRSLRFGAGLVASSLVAAVVLVVGGTLATRDQQRQLELQSDSASQPSAVASTLAPVTMTPDEAREDVPRTPPGCYLGFDGTEVPPAAACRIGAERGVRTIALIGDSHALHWAPALEKAAQQRNWTVYVFSKGACPVADVAVWAWALKGPYASCAQWRANMLERVSSIRGLDAVVIGRYQDYRDLVLLGGDKRSDARTVAGPWKAASARSFARLSEAAPRIIVLRDTPRPPEDVPTCLSRHLDDSQCGFPRSSGTGLDAVLAAAEKDAAPDAVRFVDLTATICPTATCPVVGPGGQVIFRDRHHLAATYSATLGTPLSDAIEEAIRTP
jgi:peptidoglycan/LPS O-acetylase OafA/YrhL